MEYLIQAYARLIESLAALDAPAAYVYYALVRILNSVPQVRDLLSADALAYLAALGL